MDPSPNTCPAEQYAINHVNKSTQADTHTYKQATVYIKVRPPSEGAMCSADLSYGVQQQRVRHIVASRAAPLEIILLPCS